MAELCVQVVVIRFGHDWDPTCMKMDDILFSVAEKCRNFAIFYLVDISTVPDFNKMYELYDPCTGNVQFLHFMQMYRGRIIADEPGTFVCYNN